MKIIDLKSKSSTGNYYMVRVEIDERVKVSCNCDAGKFGKLCKHKTGLLAGDESLLYDKNEKSKLNDLKNILQSSYYHELVKELLEAEMAVEVAKKKEKQYKQKLETELKNGIKLK